MSRSIREQQCGDGPSPRSADLGDAGGFLGSDERAGLAREQGRTRDAVLQSGVGEENTGAPRGVGEWVGLALIALWWGRSRGWRSERGRKDCHRLPGTCQHLPPSAISCHALPVWNEDSVGREPGPSTLLSQRVVEDVSTNVGVTKTECRSGARLRVARVGGKSGVHTTLDLSPSATSLLGGNDRGGNLQVGEA